MFPSEIAMSTLSVLPTFSQEREEITLRGEWGIRHCSAACFEADERSIDSDIDSHSCRFTTTMSSSRRHNISGMVLRSLISFCVSADYRPRF